MTIPREDATNFLENEDFDTIGLEETYALEELVGLEERVKSDYIKEAKKHEFNLPVLTTKDIKTLVERLSIYRESIKDRVTNI